MWKVLLCDNRENWLGELSLQITSLYGPQSVQLKTFRCGDALLFYLQERLPFVGMIFLSVETDGGKGIEIAREIVRQSPDALIIFLADQDHYYSDVYAVPHLYFLTTPVKKGLLGKVFELAGDQLPDREQRYIVIRNKKYVRRIPVHHILYAEKEKRKIWVYVENPNGLPCASEDGMSDDFLKVGFYGKMEDFLAVTDMFPYIIRCHQSFSVNLSRAVELSENGFTLQNGKVIPVSRTYYSSSKCAYLNFLNQELL